MEDFNILLSAMNRQQRQKKRRNIRLELDFRLDVPDIYRTFHLAPA